MRVKKNAFQIY